MPLINAVVLHNVSLDTFFRYDPETSTLHHAHTFDVQNFGESHQELCDLVWLLTNLDETAISDQWNQWNNYLDQVQQYRQRENRSLSVGDVIVLVQGEAVIGCYVAAPIGFELARAIDFTSLGATNDAARSDARVAWLEYINQPRVPAPAIGF